MSAPQPPSATGVVFSSAKLPESNDEKAQPVATIHSVSDSTKSSPTPSINDPEKAESTFEDDEKALARYLVPALEKGQKNARLKPPSLWIKFRVWYNPYRMVSLSMPTLKYRLTRSDDRTSASHLLST